MYLVNAQQMRQIDRFAMEEIGIPGIVLMETAGQQVVAEVEKRWPSCNVLVIAGHGNNGGDAFVVARHLANRGYVVRTWLVGSIDKMTVDCSTAYHAFIHSKFSVETLRDENWSQFFHQVQEADIIIDGMLGTGIRGSMRDPLPKIITAINTSRKGQLIAIDIPSGIHADTGEVLGVAIQADMTVTFAYPKWGQYLFPGADYCGQVIVKDISIPAWVSGQFQLSNQLLEDCIVARLLPKRPRHSHKGTYGHVLLVSGSTEFIGAPALAAKAVLHSGAGMATIALPESIQPMVAGQVVEAIYWPWPNINGRFSKDSWKRILERKGRYDFIVVGPGIGQSMGVEWLTQIIHHTTEPLLLDADALNLLAGNTQILKGRKQVVITPHPGEMARLLGISVKEVEQNRPQLARQFATENQIHVVLKGTYPIVAAPNGELFVSSRGSSSLAKGGSGDVLSGMIASFTNQTRDLLKGILLGVYLHGMSGEFMDEYSGVASEISAQIGEAIKRLHEVST